MNQNWNQNWNQNQNKDYEIYDYEYGVETGYFDRNNEVIKTGDIVKLYLEEDDDNLHIYGKMIKKDGVYKIININDEDCDFWLEPGINVPIKLIEIWKYEPKN